MAPITKMMLAFALEFMAVVLVCSMVDTIGWRVVIGLPLVMAIHFAVEVLIPTKMPD